MRAARVRESGNIYHPIRLIYAALCCVGICRRRRRRRFCYALRQRRLYTGRRRRCE